MDAEASVKAEVFAEFARSRDWTATARKITHRDYPDKRYAQAGWTVIARRGGEVITATWIDEVAIGPIGWHSTPDAQTPIPNQATARRLIDADQDTTL
jgi:hypothetical protein